MRLPLSFTFSCAWSTRTSRSIRNSSGGGGIRGLSVMCEPPPTPMATPSTEASKNAAARPPMPPSKTPQYCTFCGGPLQTKVPPGDERARKVCGACGMVAYENPKIIAACVALSEDGLRVLLARRAIMPMRGRWGVPAGFMEMGESADDAAKRECWEECFAKTHRNERLIAVYSVLPAKQVQLVYRATLANEREVKPGIESLETKMFMWEEIPWDELAFSTNRWALMHAKETLGQDEPRVQLRSKLDDGSFVDSPNM